MATTLTLRNIPEELYEKLKENAALNRRSINSEILVIIENSILDARRLSVEETLKRASELRNQIKAHDISPEELIEAKNQGRP